MLTIVILSYGSETPCGRVLRTVWQNGGCVIHYRRISEQRSTILQSPLFYYQSPIYSLAAYVIILGETATTA